MGFSNPGHAIPSFRHPETAVERTHHSSPKPSWRHSLKVSHPSLAPKDEETPRAWLGAFLGETFLTSTTIAIKSEMEQLMSLNRYRNAIAIFAAASLIAAAPPGQSRAKRVKSVAAQTGAAGGSAAGAAAGGSILQSSWMWALAGVIAAGGITAVALSDDDDRPVSPAS